MYKLLIRPLLFCLPPEASHTVSLRLLHIAHQLKLLPLIYPPPASHSIELFGLHFKNRIGIAAGLDKNGDYIDALAALGVGFIEVGAITPKAQTGNPKPRLFRLTKHRALINRMGFNNKGVDYLVENLKRRQSNCIVGVNIGKNKDTPLESAEDDYSDCLKKIFPHADFATINISSPNTPGLRELQTPHYIQHLLLTVKKCRDQLQEKAPKPFPLFVKIAPDLEALQIEQLVNEIVQTGMDGIIQTNTALFRSGITDSPLAKETGGLSGHPIAAQAMAMLQKIRARYPHFPLISVGGIDSPNEALRRFRAGADLIQLYTGLIYEGPHLIRKIATQVPQIRHSENVH